MGETMKAGVFLGHRRSANAYIIADVEGKVITSRTIQRRPLPEQWLIEPPTGLLRGGLAFG